MGKVLRGLGIAFKVLIVGAFLLAHFIANLIGILVCAITTEG